MTCEQMNPFLDAASGGPMPPQALDHLRDCARCGAIFRWAENRRLGRSVPRPLEERIERTVLESLEPVRPLPSVGRFVAGFLGAFAVVALLGIAIGGERALHKMTALQVASVLALTIGSAVLLAISLGREMFPGAYKRNWIVCPRTLLVWVSPAVILSLLLLFPWQSQGRPFATGIYCTLGGLVLFSLPLGAACWLILRRGAILSAGIAGANTGLLAGIGAVLILQVACPTVEGPHLALWHGAVPVLTALGGYGLGRIWQRRAETRP